MFNLNTKFARSTTKSRKKASYPKRDIMRDLGRFDHEILSDIGLLEDRFEEAADVWIRMSSKRQQC